MNYFKQCWDGHAPPPEGLKNAEANQKMKAKRPDNKFDLWFKGGAVDKFFLVTARGSNVTTEIRAGITTFLTAAYISPRTGLNLQPAAPETPPAPPHRRWSPRRWFGQWPSTRTSFR